MALPVLARRRSGAFAGAQPPNILTFTPDGSVGDSVVITGTKFKNVRSVSFVGAVASTFSVDSEGQITVTVPANSQDGPLTVATKGGNASSVSEFTVDPTVYVNEHFDTAVPPALPAGWASRNGTVITSTAQAFSGANSVRITGTNEFVYLYYSSVLDTNFGNTQVEAKFRSLNNPPTDSCYINLWLRTISGVPVVSGSTFYPGYSFSIGMDSGFIDLRFTNDSNTPTTLLEVQRSIVWNHTTWHRAIFVVEEVPDRYYHHVHAYVQRMDTNAWLQPDGTWATGVQTACAAVKHQLNYVNGWVAGGFCMVGAYLGVGQGMYVDDVKFLNSPLVTGNKPFQSTPVGAEVEFVGTITTDSAGKTNYETNKLNTGDLTRYYWSTNTFNGWAMLDCGVAVTPTAIVWSPGQDADFDNDGTEQFMMGAVFEGANASTGPWTQLGRWRTDGYPEPNVYNTLRLNTAAPGGTYRYIRIRAVADPCNVAAFRVFGINSGGVSWKPVPPQLTPLNGRFVAGSTVTMTSQTTGASIYYTTDGTTPILSGGVPQGTTTLYSGPVTIPSNAPAETTVKAVSYHTSGNVTTSEVTTGIYMVARTFVPDTLATAFGTSVNWPGNWYDDRGILLNSNTGAITFDASTQKYFWVGQTMNGKAVAVTNAGILSRGFWIYSSTDLYNWSFEKQILVAIPPSFRDENNTIFTLQGRPSFLINPSPNDVNNKYVLWFHIGNGTSANFAGCYTSPTIQGPYTFRNSLRPNGANVGDLSTFLDDDGKAYLVAADYCCQLDPATDWTTTTGANIAFPILTHREAPCLFKHGGYYFLIVTDITNFGSSTNNGVFYFSATTLSGLASASGQHPWNPTTPATARVAYNAQSACVFPVQGKSAPAFIFLLDYQDPTESPVNMYHARSIWLPINSTSIPSPGVLSIPFNSYNSWDLSVFP